MKKLNDGGPAFPVPDSEYQFQDKGMALRDWLAGQALAGVCANSSPLGPSQVSELVSLSYALADAMIAERNKTQ